ncbi:hypothetical protein N7510_000613 [Penicillium lagena]|uniref:uncharacterized protein n=1 Tax=Penicillium lagena TaxID=94218 RepID=UPI002542377E|nr:uncharacterized protein N7510_000613 [Penicillium lagena]KAJ5624304.1 hypothetical protein N7510_000613 [Penicillium lagena]
MDVFDLFPRAGSLYHTCSSGTQWYVCSKGGYSGCCSSDPCTKGICPDDDSIASSTTTSPTKSSSTSPSKTSTETKTSIPSLPTTSTLADATAVQTTTSAASVTAPTTASTAVATATSSSSPSTHYNNRGAIIGGLVGGIAAVALCIVLFFLCWRRKKKQGRFSISWRRSQTNASYHDPEMTSTPGTNFSRSTNDTSCLSNSSAGLLTGSSIESSTLGQATQQTSSSKDLASPPQIHPITTTTTRTSLMGITAELSDTGFWRTYCELPHNPQRELINLSLSQRRRRAVQQQFQQSLSRHQLSTLQNWGFLSSTGSSPRSSSQDCLANAPPLPAQRQIVTKEGVVLGANMNRYSTAFEFTSSPVDTANEKGKEIQQQCAAHDRDHDHVMSFMQYDNATGTDGSSQAVELPGNPRTRTESLVRKTSISGAVAPAPALTSMPSLALFREDEVVYSPSDMPPTYAVEEGVSPKDVKSPCETIG